MILVYALNICIFLLPSLVSFPVRDLLSVVSVVLVCGLYAHLCVPGGVPSCCVLQVSLSLQIPSVARWRNPSFVP